MKKHTINIITLFMSFICLGVQAMPVYTDDIPQDYLKKVNQLGSLNKTRETTNNISENNAVKIYTPEHILIMTKAKKINNKYVLTQNINVNDKVKFIVSEDVKKDGILFIPKGSEVTGIIRTAEPGNQPNCPPGVLEISYFSTKDVKGNKVNLYGKITEEAPETGLFQIILPYIPSLNPAIKRNKIYTLYYK